MAVEELEAIRLKDLWDWNKNVQRMKISHPHFKGCCLGQTKMQSPSRGRNSEKAEITNIFPADVDSADGLKPSLAQKKGIEIRCPRCGARQAPC